MIVKACCKINIGLNIVRKREDGYHDLVTAMYPVSELFDTVTVVKNDTPHSRFVGRGMVVDCPDEHNICMKAARLMQQLYGTGGVTVTLDKRVPFGAGLGGGSSDGTAVLKAMNDIFGLALGDSRLEELAAMLGSDTPFFVKSTPRLCTGRGEIMHPAAIDLHGMMLAVVKPDESVSTREAYAGVTPSVPVTELTEILKRPVKEWRGLLKNDFEPHVFEAHPRIAELKESMYGQGAAYAAMSGSGSAVFGLFEQETHYVPPFGGVFVHTQIL